MKTRKHHNNKGNRQIKNGGTRKFVQYLRHKIGLGRPDGTPTAVKGGQQYNTEQG